MEAYRVLHGAKRLVTIHCPSTQCGARGGLWRVGMRLPERGYAWSRTRSRGTWRGRGGREQEEESAASGARWSGRKRMQPGGEEKRAQLCKPRLTQCLAQFMFSTISGPLLCFRKAGPLISYAVCCGPPRILFYIWPNIALFLSKRKLEMNSSH
jgi:hypothetical protein